MEKLIAYHGKKEIKIKYVNRMKDHIKKDELIHGEGWNKGKGCAIGCTLNRYDHHCYQNELGLPEWLARMEDEIFEGMSLKKSMTFPLELLEAIPIGANLDKVYHKFCKFILTDIAKDCDELPVRKAIETILSQHDKAIRGEIITIPELWRMADKLIQLLKESNN